MKIGKFPQRGDVFWVSLDPTVGSEINKTRPCLIVSNDVANANDFRVIVVPLTSKIKKVYSFEVVVEVDGKKGKVLLDQIRSIDKERLGKKIDILNALVMYEIDRKLKIVLALA